jgi:pyruvate dehydrogenase E2 component (dihydrolipoamide acetyltransferase)
VLATNDVRVPDIGDFKDVPIIEVHVNPGDTVRTDDPLVTLESDKATMDVPAPSEGTVDQVLVKVGDKVSEGSRILVLKVEEAGAAAEQQGRTPLPQVIAQQEPSPSPRQQPAAPPALAPQPSAAAASTPGAEIVSFAGVHASPAVRRLARELGVDLTKLKGTGDKGRVTKEDVKGFLKGPAAAPAAPAGGMGIPEIPVIDFAKFGPVETKPLSRIKRISGPHLHRAWLNVPHVTHGDEADITDIEAYRKQLDNEAKADKKKPYRVSLLPFLMKASVATLKTFPEFNSSLTPEKDALIYKKYYNIGIAVDTPEGLVVPVIKDVDRKGILELSRELGDASAKARDGKLAPGDMQGGSFTISSLGGIGGTDFTPIVSAPEVAILGVVRSKMAPVWDGEQFRPRLMLPLYVSYDHRVIDGALAARFMRHLCTVLEDMRRLVL